MPTNEGLLDLATDPVRLATTIRPGLETAERTTPAINKRIADLATLGITDSRSRDQQSIAGPPACRPSMTMSSSSIRRRRRG
jgi:hypothetical protein